MSSHVPATASRSATVPPTASTLDWIERIAVSALFCWLVARILVGINASGGGVNILLLLSEGLVVLFMLIRRPTENVSRRFGDWTLAFLATSAPLMVIPILGSSLLPTMVVAAFFLIGMFIQLHAKIVLGRSFGLVAANRGLKLSGPYRMVRHPMYTGYLLTHLAFLALNPCFWNIAVYALCYGLQIPRLLAEEKLLSRDSKYLNYKTIVRYRMVPGIF